MINDDEGHTLFGICIKKINKNHMTKMLIEWNGLN